MFTWLSDYHTRELETLIKYRFAIYWQDRPHWSYPYNLTIFTWLSDYPTKELKSLIKHIFAINWQELPRWLYSYNLIIFTWLSDIRELKTLIKYRFAIYWQDQPHWSCLAAQLLLDFAPRIASPLQVPYKMMFKFNTASSHYNWKNYNLFLIVPVWQRAGGGGGQKPIE